MGKYIPTSACTVHNVLDCVSVGSRGVGRQCCRRRFRWTEWALVTRVKKEAGTSESCVKPVTEKAPCISGLFRGRPR